MEVMDSELTPNTAKCIILVEVLVRGLKILFREKKEYLAIQNQRFLISVGTTPKILNPVPIPIFLPQSTLEPVIILGSRSTN